MKGTDILISSLFVTIIDVQISYFSYVSLNHIFYNYEIIFLHRHFLIAIKLTTDPHRHFAQVLTRIFLNQQKFSNISKTNRIFGSY